MWLPFVKKNKLPTVNDYLKENTMAKNPFDGPNPFTNVKTQEDFLKAMEIFTRQLDEACSELDTVEQEINAMTSELGLATDKTQN
jgi:hypothetical protein